MKKFFSKIFSFFIKHRQVTTFIICLCVSLFLWLFITYGREYQHSVVYTINFIDNTNKVEYHTQDSIITIGITTNGFAFLARNLNNDKKHITINVEKLNINLSKGKATIPSSRFKDQITKILDIRGQDISITPANINLTWRKLYSKKVNIVNTCSFKFKKTYNNYFPPELLIKQAVIEGNANDISKINQINTKPIVFENIFGSGVFLAPLDLATLPKGVNCHLKSVPIKLTTERYTENTIELPVKVIRYEDYRNIKVLPKKVKVRYSFAIKDYKKVNQREFNAFVICSDEAMQKRSKLKVTIGNVPDYVRIVNVYPEKVEYILFK